MMKGSIACMNGKAGRSFAGNLRKSRRGAALAVLAGLLVSPGPATAETGVAVFPFELYDTSGEPRTAAHDRRLRMVTGQLRDGLDGLDAYVVVPLTPVADRLPDLGHIYGCNGCELDLAKAVGAEQAATGLVHKVSTLIQYIQITVKDVATGRVLRRATASIRGDTDEAWSRGVAWLIEHRLAKGQEIKAD